jgi:hypothetical protein
MRINLHFIIKIFKTVTRLPLHPFLVSALFVLESCRALPSNSKAYLTDLIIAIVISLFIPAVLLLVFRAFRANKIKAAIIVTILLILIFYFPLCIFVMEKFSAPLARPRFLFPLFLIIIVLIISYVIRTPRTFARTQQWLNATFSFLVIITILSLNTCKPATCTLDPALLYKSNNFILLPATLQKRDIIYILLDGHASPANLKLIWNYDEAEFIESLQKKGFCFAKKSLCLFPLTWVSMASTLNMSYSSEFVSIPIHDYNNILNKCVVANFLASSGYKIINLSIFSIHNEKKFYPPICYDERIDNGVGKIFRNSLPLFVSQQLHVHTISQTDNNIISKLETLRKEQDTTPLFVYAHISAPHFPYSYDHNGRVIPWIHRKASTDKYAYLENLRGIDKLILPAIDSLIARPGPKPIIVIQSDHGSRLFNKTPYKMESYAILNAFYLPEADTTILNENLSPYNTFRVIFNLYLGQHLPLLEDGVHY